MQEFDVGKTPMTQGERSVPQNKIKLFHVSTDTLDLATIEHDQRYLPEITDTIRQAIK